jgi:hypothetical protein
MFNPRMKSLIYLLSLTIAPQIFALEFRVEGPCASEILTLNQAAPEGQDLLTLSQSVLGLANIESEIRFPSLVSIANIAPKVEAMVDGTIRAYGWCFSVDGIAPDSLPGETLLFGDEQKIEWFYAFAEYRNGQWGKMCARDRDCR